HVIVDPDLESTGSLPGESPASMLRDIKCSLCSSIRLAAMFGQIPSPSIAPADGRPRARRATEGRSSRRLRVVEVLDLDACRAKLLEFEFRTPSPILEPRSRGRIVERAIVLGELPCAFDLAAEKLFAGGDDGCAHGSFSVGSGCSTSHRIGASPHTGHVR